MGEPFDRKELLDLTFAIKRKMLAQGGKIADAVGVVDLAVEQTVKELRERGDL